MGSFTYTARSKSGEKVDGTVEANDRRGALALIEQLGYVPISVTEGGGAAAGKVAGKRKSVLSFESRRPARMSSREMLNFSVELSDLLAAGMTLGNALNVLATQRSERRGRDDVVADLRDEILQGSSLSSALARHPRSFPSLYANLVKAGEASGALAEVLTRIVAHYERMHETRDKIMMALIYPAFVLVVGLGIVLFVMLSVVPKFQMVFNELGSTLPAPMRILMGISHATAAYGWMVATGLAVLAVFGNRAVKTERGRLWWDGFLLKVPFVRSVLSSGTYANFARTLGTLLANGVPVLQALGITEQTIGNTVLAREIRNARERVTDGTTISGPLAAGKVFPRMMTDMLAVGEQTGNVPGSLSHVARRYEQVLDRNIKILTTALEPMLIIVITGFVGFIAYAVITTVFSLTSGLDVPM